MDARRGAGDPAEMANFMKDRSLLCEQQQQSEPQGYVKFAHASGNRGRTCTVTGFVH